MTNPSTVPADSCFTPEQGLLSVEDALARLLGDAQPCDEPEATPLHEALERVLAIDQWSALAVPPDDNSAMDGYAIATASLQSNGPTRLPISQRIAAGSVPTTLAPGSAARIFTGAPLPPGADAVVMQEQTQVDGDHVVIPGPVPTGNFVRSRGEDILPGALVLSAGTRLQPQHLGLAASVGLATLPVMRQPRVSILSTGSELVEPGGPLPAGKIYDANSVMLATLARRAGCRIVRCTRVADDLQRTAELLQRCAADSDVILTSGGASVGEEDHVKAALQERGRLVLWRIAVKPGKPLLYGRIGASAVLGLPGNPVSAFVTFCLFARPYLLKLQGAKHLDVPTWPLPAAFAWPKPGNRREYLRARRIRMDDGTERAIIHSNQSSGVLSAVTWADGLVCIAEGRTVKPGESVPFIPLSEWL